MYSINVYDSNCYDISSNNEIDDNKKGSFYSNIDTKLEFIDEQIQKKGGYNVNNKMIKILKEQVMELVKRLKIE